MNTSGMKNMDDKDTFYPFITGPRIYLRDVRPSDVGERYYRWMNDPEITQFLESRFLPNSMASLEAYVKGKQDDSSEIFLALLVKDGRQHIGNIKLGPIDWIHRIADIGILIGEKAFWGKGYATEAIQLITGYAFDTLNLHKVAAGCYTINPGAIRTFEKAGFEIEGVRKEHAFYKGVYTDLVLLGCLNSKLKNTNTSKTE
jgi:RimJ/RimL family protein N-acetyltransferase